MLACLNYEKNNIENYVRNLIYVSGNIDRTLKPHKLNESTVNKLN